MLWRSGQVYRLNSVALTVVKVAVQVQEVDLGSFIQDVEY